MKCSTMAGSGSNTAIGNAGDAENDDSPITHN